MDEINVSGASNQLRYFVDTLISPAGLLGLALIIGLTIFALVNRNGRWIVLSLMLYATSLMIFVDKSLQFALPSGGMLDGLREKGRPLSTGLLIALLPITFTSERGWRSGIFGGAAIWLFAFQIACSVRYAVDEQWSRAFAGTLIFLLMFVVLGVGVPKWLQTFADADRLVGAVAGAGILLSALGALQMLLSPGSVLIHNRFMGTTGNPQHVAVMLALVIPATAYLLARGTVGPLHRNLYRAALGTEALFLAWTGSRTGLLMTTVALAYMFRRRLGKFAGVLGAGAAVMFVALQLFSASSGGISFERLMSTEDTRSVVWQGAVDRFLNSPILGSSSEGGFVENSYLATLTRFGFVGILPMVVLLVFMLRNSYKLWAARDVPAEFTQLADLVVAALFAILIGSFFEAYLLANIGFPISVLWIFLAIQTFLRDAAPMLAPGAFDPVYSAYDYDQAAELGRA